MQLTIPDCCLGEFCPGIHVDGHNRKTDGTYYSADDYETNAYHYHNTDGSVFYRYSDGSEYYRRKNGNITFRPPESPPVKVEGADPTAAPPPTVAERVWRPWYDWPPQLNISVKTDGPLIIIRDNSGSTVTFEAVGSGAAVDPVPAHDTSLSLERAILDRGGSQTGCGATFGVQEWVRNQALANIVGRGQD